MSNPETITTLPSTDPTPRRKRRLRRWIRAVAAIIIGWLLFRAFEHSQVYHPDRTFRSTGAELGREFEEVHFRAADGTSLHGWFFPASTNRDLAVMVCHGNAGNIGDRLHVSAAFLSSGLSVLLFDYRGYGRSAGRPSEEGTYQDAEAAYRWLMAKGFPANRIIVHGESLGGGVASALAVRAPVAGLILQSTYTSIPDLGLELFPWLWPLRWMASIQYDTRSRLPSIRVPVLFLHSREDTLVRFRHAERNYAVANEPKKLFELAGDHNDGVTDQKQFAAGVKWLLDRVNEAPPPSRPE